MKTNLTKTHDYFPNHPASQGMRRIVLSLVLLLALQPVLAQGVSRIITDFNGYWTSGASAINPSKPDNSHNLLAFTYNGNSYSTGVNDSLLTAHGETFIAESYSALPVSALTGKITGNTKIGLGASYDHVPNGPGNPTPANDPAKYLTDGINGLDLGTCVANLPAGQLLFAVERLNYNTVGDGVPDLVITQIADPSGSSLDTYEFADINGNRVGNSVTVALQNLPVVGNWTADFYEASAHPMNLSSGFTHTDRPIRLWTADFSSFGIDSLNVKRIAYFRINLNGNSDVAFVAYNNAALNLLSSLLPVSLQSFSGHAEGSRNFLSWTSTNEIHFDHYDVERSIDGTHFNSIGQRQAIGNPVSNFYNFADEHPAPGISYYRLKMVDKGDKITYSASISIHRQASANAILQAFPNPAGPQIQLRHAPAAGAAFIRIYHISGMLLCESTCSPGSCSETINLQQVPKGQFIVEFQNGSSRQRRVMLKQ